MTFLKSQKGPFVGEEDLSGEDDNFDADALLRDFWPAQMLRIENLPSDFFRDQHRCPELPLARIKKVMKIDEDLKNSMISAEAPLLFAKAIEMFVEELTLRAWTHTDNNKRKTLQKTDLAIAIANFDQFDFLVDIVPRDEWLKMPPPKKSNGASSSNANQSSNAVTVLNGSQQLINQIMTLVGQNHSNQRSNAVQQQQQQQQHAPSTIHMQNGQVVQATPIGQPIQLIAGQNGQLQLIQQQQQSSQRVQSQQASAPQAPPPPLIGPQSVQSNSSAVIPAQTSSDEQAPQVFQQVIGPDGTVQHIPVQLQLSPAQLQFLKAQYSNPPTTSASGNVAVGNKRCTVRQLLFQAQTQRGASDTLHQHSAAITVSPPTLHQHSAATTVNQAWPSTAASSQQSTVIQRPSQLVQISVNKPQQQPQGHKPAASINVGQEVVVQSTASNLQPQQQQQAKATTIRTSTGSGVVTVRLTAPNRLTFDKPRNTRNI